MITPPQRLKDRYSFTDFLYYTGLLAVPAVIAVTAMARHSTNGLIGYALLALGLLPVMLRFFCTRCPHYNRDERFLNCIFFRGMPKFFTPRPGKYTGFELFLSLGAPMILALYPVYWLMKEPGLFLAYVIALGVFGASIFRNECPRCIHADCPGNRSGIV